APSCWGLRLSAPKGFAGKRKSGSRYAAWARLRFFCPQIPSELGRTSQVATSGKFFSVVTDYILHSFIKLLKPG
ncbi:hypothetical protein, partial [Brevibacillus formosus]|uniref:hypothetical protein n=1 Tax=Brevibacillus formosus TaxID=54913 RepID=UPI003D1C08D0